MLTTIEKVLFLQRVPMFEGLSSRHLRVIADISEEEQLAANKYVFEEGQPGDKMYIIVDGQVAIEKVVEGGHPITLGTLEKRDILGDMAVLDDQPRSASAKTLQDATLLAVGSNSIHDLIREYPEIAFGLLKFCAQRIRDSNKRMQAMGEKPAAGPAASASPAVPRTPRLQVTHGPDTGKAFAITGDVVKLGRSTGAEMEAMDRFTVRDSLKQISRNHAEVFRQDGVFHVKDTGSVNGTFVNDQKVTDPVALKAGDVIRLGSEARIRFDG